MCVYSSYKCEGLKLMRQTRIFFLAMFLALSLIGCNKEPLKFRNMIEADQYVRNNISKMKWSDFQMLLSEKNDVTSDDFNYIKDILSKSEKTSHVEVKRQLYRFDENYDLMYVVEWESKDQLLYIKDIHYIKE